MYVKISTVNRKVLTSMGKFLSYLRFANDIVLMSSDPKELENKDCRIKNCITKCRPRDESTENKNNEPKRYAGHPKSRNVEEYVYRQRQSDCRNNQKDRVDLGSIR
ncbi:hypothetical protein JTB14_001878 [Gonioctena quinquepunctata]|nr:hypothetical protein JTB14_001878 [Gonioctena quinquepunctata]